MELTRRDALAALAGGGVAVGGASALAWDRLGDDGGETPDVPTGETLTALAAAVYPSAVDGVDEFVETYVVGRASGRPEYERGVVETAALVETYAVDWFDAPVSELSREERDELLRQMGAETADPDPEGSVAERVRYYVVDELQYALYTSPAGGELVGIENPQGYAGGTESYRRGPKR
ncbi:gluconate 2-dehydrogenase subunit 3 family protein [Haloprofundus halophilus]|uniref:gluconate 2-dehydrogenase subunit 3 family protein n=1 Tax=Haloprofundus halophilus TaxID=2283527 RepID=UPI000E4348AE|nr:gluconate 2-dehydrogenase subunit 3 family protein [Haloprofundus halophilus]